MVGRGIGRKCEEVKCLNGGSCVQAARAAVCFCPSGYTGQWCESTLGTHVPVEGVKPESQHAGGTENWPSSSEIIATCLILAGGAVVLGLFVILFKVFTKRSSPPPPPPEPVTPSDHSDLTYMDMSDTLSSISSHGIKVNGGVYNCSTLPRMVTDYSLLPRSNIQNSALPVPGGHGNETVTYVRQESTNSPYGRNNPGIGSCENGFRAIGQATWTQSGRPPAVARSTSLPRGSTLFPADLPVWGEKLPPMNRSATMANATRPHYLYLRDSFCPVEAEEAEEYMSMSPETPSIPASVSEIIIYGNNAIDEDTGGIYQNTDKPA